MKRCFIAQTFFVRGYEVIRDFGCISYTERAANPVIPVVAELLRRNSSSTTRVLISLALSLALPPLDSATRCLLATWSWRRGSESNLRLIKQDFGRMA